LRLLQFYPHRRAGAFHTSTTAIVSHLSGFFSVCVSGFFHFVSLGFASRQVPSSSSVIENPSLRQSSTKVRY
jgi:hypothetical protein